MFRASCRAGGICCRGLFGLDRLLDRLHEHLGRLECRNIVCRDLDSGVLGDIATGFLCTALDDEATETAEINVLSVFERILHLFHKSSTTACTSAFSTPFASEMLDTISAFVILGIF